MVRIAFGQPALLIFRLISHVLQFSFESCNFRVQRNKEGTGRIVIWMLGITNSYTMEASFGGSTLGGRNRTHFSTAVSYLPGSVFDICLISAPRPISNRTTSTWGAPSAKRSWTTRTRIRPK